MRYLIFSILLLCATVTTFAQVDQQMTITVPANGTSVSAADLFAQQTLPSFPGGDTALVSFIKRTMQYPPLAKKHKIQGKVTLSFVVGNDGKLSDISVLKDIGAGCGKEAIRIAEQMPAWVPGTSGGKPVKVKYTQVIQFEVPD